MKMLKIILSITVTVILVYILYSAYEIKTHALKRQLFIAPQFALSMLVPRGFKYDLDANTLTISDDKVIMKITRHLWPADKLFAYPGTDTVYNPRVSTMERLKIPDELIQQTESEQLYKNVISKSSLRRVKEPIMLDGKEIYFSGFCYYSRSTQQPLDFYRFMELFIKKNKYDSVEFCIEAVDKVNGVKNFEDYQDIADKIIMSMKDISNDSNP